MILFENDHFNIGSGNNSSFLSEFATLLWYFKEPKQSAINTSYLTNRTKRIKYKQHEEKQMNVWLWMNCVHWRRPVYKEPTILFMLHRLSYMDSITFEFIMNSVYLLLFLKRLNYLLLYGSICCWSRNSCFAQWWVGCVVVFFFSFSLRQKVYKWVHLHRYHEKWFYITSFQINVILINMKK